MSLRLIPYYIVELSSSPKWQGYRYRPTTLEQSYCLSYPIALLPIQLKNKTLQLKFFIRNLEILLAYLQETQWPNKLNWRLKKGNSNENAKILTLCFEILNIYIIWWDFSFFVSHKPHTSWFIKNYNNQWADRVALWVVLSTVDKGIHTDCSLTQSLYAKDLYRGNGLDYGPPSSYAVFNYKL